QMVVGRSKVAGSHWEATRWTLHDGAFFSQSLELVPALGGQAPAQTHAGEMAGSLTLPPDRTRPARRAAWLWHDGPLGESLGDLDSGDDATAAALNSGGFLNPKGAILRLGNL